jgi:hypothetical protein
MIQPINQLKQWFSKYKYPTQSQFWDWLDSFWHKDDSIPADNISGLEDMFNGIASGFNEAINTKQDITDNNLFTNNKTVVGAINELNSITEKSTNKGVAGGYAPLNSEGKIDEEYLEDYITQEELETDLSEYQKITDNTLTTTNKAVSGAINELKTASDNLQQEINANTEAIAQCEEKANKGVAGGYAPLNSEGKIDEEYLEDYITEEEAYAQFISARDRVVGQSSELTPVENLSVGYELGQLMISGSPYRTWEEVRDMQPVLQGQVFLTITTSTGYVFEYINVSRNITFRINRDNSVLYTFSRAKYSPNGEGIYRIESGSIVNLSLTPVSLAAILSLSTDTDFGTITAIDTHNFDISNYTTLSHRIFFSHPVVDEDGYDVIETINADMIDKYLPTVLNLGTNQERYLKVETDTNGVAEFEWAEVETDLSEYQKITDNTLTTTNKTVPGAINELKTASDNIGSVIPSNATSANKVATEAFVNSSIQAIAANPVYPNANKGMWMSAAQVHAATTFYNGNGDAYTPDKDDYLTVVADEEAPAPYTGGQSRWKFNGTEFVYEFGLNLTLTQKQTDTLNSGFVAADKAKLDGIDVDNLELISNKGVAGGYASLGNDGKVPSSQLPAGQDTTGLVSKSSFPNNDKSIVTYISAQTVNNLATLRIGTTTYLPDGSEVNGYYNALLPSVSESATGLATPEIYNTYRKTAIETFPFREIEGNQNFNNGFVANLVQVEKDGFLNNADICVLAAHTSGTYQIALYDFATGGLIGQSGVTNFGTTENPATIGLKTISFNMSLSGYAGKLVYIVIFINGYNRLLAGKRRMNNLGGTNMHFAFTGSDTEPTQLFSDLTLGLRYPQDGNLDIPWVRLY